MVNKIKVIAFDADDTLWDCQGHFEQVMQQLYDELQPWSSRDEAANALFAIERKNMPLLGFGTKAFTLSLLETALEASRHEIATDRLAHLLQLGYSLLRLPATPLPGVVETLQAVADDPQTRHLRRVVFTKGELLDQQNKLRRSGLAHFFEHEEIVSDKGEDEFRQLCHTLGCQPEEMVMVGNSLKSDIAPALAIGAWAIHVPFHITWELEHADHFSHDRMYSATHFSEIKDIIHRLTKNS